MGKLSSILNRYHFERLRLEADHELLQIPGPGVVIVTCEKKPGDSAQPVYDLLEVVEAPNKLEAATRLLKKNWGTSCKGQVAAWVASVPDNAQRQFLVSELESLRGTS